MADLRRIEDGVAFTAIGDDVLSAEDPRSLVSISESDTEVVRGDIDLDGLDELVVETLSRFERFDTTMDRHFAVPLHQVLPLSRRQAADRNLWAWLGLVRYPQLVAHRWKPSGNLRSAERFVGNRVRQTFARLWWASELTVGEGGDYGLTHRMLKLSGFQDVYEALFGRAFSQYRPALSAFVLAVGHRPEAVVRETAKELGYLLTTVVLEALDESQLCLLLEQVADRVEERVVAARPA